MRSAVCISLAAMLIVFAASAIPSKNLSAQTSLLIDDDVLQALIDSTSGSRALGYFDDLLAYSGWSPSLGADQTADYLAAKATAFGLEDVQIHRFPSDGDQYFWAFRTEPWWEAESATLTLEGTEPEILASFETYRGHLARFSTNANLSAELVHVGSGMRNEDYRDSDVAGKIVLATGLLGRVHQLAVWDHGAVGVVTYRVRDHAKYPHLVSAQQIDPWKGPNGEQPGFGFSIAYETGMRLVDRLDSGEQVTVNAEVRAETKTGDYPLVYGVILGTEPELPEVWIQAHSNYRNTGGGNNLTGVGATLDLASVLSKMIGTGRTPRPKRSIRFVWTSEHTGLLYYFYEHPDEIPSVLALLNLDMVGDDQVKSEAMLRLYRAPYSRPSFLSDIVQEAFETVAAGNTISLLNGRLLDFGTRFTRPILDPDGTDHPFHYKIENFWGPSDHEDLGESSIGIPSVMLNTWPDPFIGTQDDSRENADATQMKRAEVIAGMAAMILANADDRALPVLGQNALGKARVRLAKERRRASDVFLGTGYGDIHERYDFSRTIIREAYVREAAALESLSALATSISSKRQIEWKASGLRDAHVQAQKWLDSYVVIVPPAEDESDTLFVADASDALVPTRTDSIRGPINFFRGQYGRDWMVEKTGDPGFRDKLRLAERGHYYLYETLNFVDGKRTLAEIRDLIGAEYGLAPVEEIEEYFRLLETVGVIRFVASR